jgi:hypothetical protein
MVVARITGGSSVCLGRPGPRFIAPSAAYNVRQGSYRRSAVGFLIALSVDRCEAAATDTFGREDPMRRKPYFVPVLMLFMAVVVFSNIAGRPSFQSFRAVDVMTLIGVGMMLGVAVTSTAFLVSGRPEQ